MPPVTLPGTPNVGTMLGQLAMPGAQAGPIATTPYAPANVAPLWMPAETPGKPPKIVQPQQNQFQFGGGGGYGGAASGPMAGTSQGSPRNTGAVDTSFASLTPAQQQARIAAGNAPPPSYGANVMAKLLAQQGIDPSSAMPNYAARVAQSQPTATARPAVQTQPTVHPQAAQSLSQTLYNMGVPAQLHPAIMQSVLQPAALGGSPVTSGRR